MELKEMGKKSREKRNIAAVIYCLEPKFNQRQTRTTVW